MFFVLLFSLGRKANSGVEEVGKEKRTTFSKFSKMGRETKRVNHMLYCMWLKKAIFQHNIFQIGLTHLKSSLGGRGRESNYNPHWFSFLVSLKKY